MHILLIYVCIVSINLYMKEVGRVHAKAQSAAAQWVIVGGWVTTRGGPGHCLGWAGLSWAGPGWPGL